MRHFGNPEYWSFTEYREDFLSDRPTIEQLAILDEEIVTKALLSRYQGPIGPNEWSFLGAYYGELFGSFVSERVAGLIDTTPIETREDQFHAFRKAIINLNQQLPSGGTADGTTISRPAERVLLKRLRQERYDPSDLDVSHISRGSGLYLLELFATAAQQSATTETDLLETLLAQTTAFKQLDEAEARALLTRPVLMVSLWENQREGLDHWLASDGEGILEMATATGKTVAGIAAIANLCGDVPENPEQTPQTDDAEIMIVAHSNAILSQWEREIRDKLGLTTRAGSGSGRPDRLSFSTATVEFYTAQSLLPRYDRDLADQYDLVVYDEVHHYSNLDGGYGEAIRRPNYDRAMGLSATIGEQTDPKRDRLEEILAPVVYTYDLQDAQRDGVIPDFDWTVHPIGLDPYEREEWEQATKSITNQFRALKHDDTTTKMLRQLSVPFTQLEDLGDFIRAHRAAELELDDVPDSWGQLQAAIQSRNWIRHRSQPKIEGAVALAREYLTGVDDGVKLVMFAMDIDTAEQLGEELSDATENVFVVHSKIAASSNKKDRMVNRRIEQFSAADHGVLIAPKLLDEGIDVPDAEVGINVSGTKTKLQLVQRMGRVLRRHGDQEPHFHHFVAVPEGDDHLAGLDDKQYVQQRHWVRELGEKIGQQPTIDEANVDDALLARAEARGNELWAQDLLDDLEIETVQGSVRMDEIVEGLTPSAVETLLDTVDFDHDTVVESDWETAMTLLRTNESLPPNALQRTWWLFPVYRNRPDELQELLRKVAQYRTASDTADDDSTPTETTSQTSTRGTSDTSPTDSGSTDDTGKLSTKGTPETTDSPSTDNKGTSVEPDNQDEDDPGEQSDGGSVVSRIKSLFS
ncbi:DEAD/DEAH box helicase [Halorubrum ezzemoulense]|uniref:DEAD/DEAH box helicase n=1 Tax=Halorubrum ezzemoulense TaxID=337243 RepID=UPI00232EA916|nr:DEAD/DEAH box helicase family protein [Halorubrum ezzemoulense]MDB9233780.1 DEAD/DEAH box helicase family protein [Halorubrum ezzemoulense]